jgi:hypothetical protein
LSFLRVHILRLFMSAFTINYSKLAPHRHQYCGTHEKKKQFRNEWNWLSQVHMQIHGPKKKNLSAAQKATWFDNGIIPWEDLCSHESWRWEIVLVAGCNSFIVWQLGIAAFSQIWQSCTHHPTCPHWSQCHSILDATEMRLNSHNPFVFWAQMGSKHLFIYVYLSIIYLHKYWEFLKLLWVFL